MFNCIKQEGPHKDRMSSALARDLVYILREAYQSQPAEEQMKVMKVVDLWLDRQVLDARFVQTLKNGMTSKQPPPPAPPGPPTMPAPAMPAPPAGVAPIQLRQPTSFGLSPAPSRPPGTPPAPAAPPQPQMQQQQQQPVSLPIDKAPALAQQPSLTGAPRCRSVWSSGRSAASSRQTSLTSRWSPTCCPRACLPSGQRQPRLSTQSPDSI